jgi:hypothetical protein
VTHHLVLEGRLVHDDAEPVARLAFDVPEGCTRVALRYRHDPGHVVDLGLLDPTAEAFPTPTGFRGWSGGARREAFVARDDATPGYLPGPLPPGRWHVLLGRARVEPGGCEYRVDVELDVDAPTEPLAETDWFPVDLQSHTHHSDAKGTIAELLAAASERGLRFLAITDHNTVSHHAELLRHADGPVLPVPGLEVTTYRGHANVWGASGWVDFRIRDDADVAAMVDRAHALGGLVSVNHPKPQPGCIGCDWAFEVPERIDALEAWQGPWWLRNWASLTRYDALLAQGRRLTLVGGSDRHQPAGIDTDPDELRVGSPTTWLRLRQRRVPDVLLALRAGQATVSEAPTGAWLAIAARPAGDPQPEAPWTRMGGVLSAASAYDVSARVLRGVGERLRWVGASGVVRETSVDADPFEDAWTWRTDGPFLRAELIADASAEARLQHLRALASSRELPYGIEPDEVAAHAWRLALSNPVYACG